MPVPGNIQWGIDARDSIVFVSDSWDASAREQGVPTRESGIIGSRLWDHIHGEPTKHMYQVLLKNIRVNLNPVGFPLRCDTSANVRVLNISVTAQPDGSVLFESSVLHERPKEECQPLDTWQFWLNQQTPELIRMCAWCSKVEYNHQWMSLPEAIAELGLFLEFPHRAITHTICEECFHNLEATSSTSGQSGLAD